MLINEEYSVNKEADILNGLDKILSKYKNITININDLNPDIFFDKEKYYLEELFEYYTPWDVRFLINEGFLRGKKLTKKDCMYLSAEYFLNSEEATKKRIRIVKNMGGVYRRITQKRWDEDNDEYKEWRKKVIKTLRNNRKNPEINKKRLNNMKEAMNTQEYKCRQIKARGVQEYRELIVRTAKKNEWRDSASLFSILLNNLEKEEKTLDFLVAKNNEEDSMFLKKCVKGNFLYLNHLIKNFYKSNVLIKASEYMEKHSINPSFYEEEFNKYKGLKKIFKISSRSGYNRNSKFHRFYFPYLITADLINHGFEESGDSERFRVLEEKSYEMLFAFLCRVPNKKKACEKFRRVNRRFLDSYTKLKKKGWINC